MQENKSFAKYFRLCFATWRSIPLCKEGCGHHSTHLHRSLWGPSSVLVISSWLQTSARAPLNRVHFQNILISWKTICFKSSHMQYSKAKILFAYLNSDTKAGAAGDGAGEEKTDLQKAALSTNNPSREGRAVSVYSSDTEKNVIAKCKVKAQQKSLSWPSLDHLQAPQESHPGWPLVCRTAHISLLHLSRFIGFWAIKTPFSKHIRGSAVLFHLSLSYADRNET